MRYILSAVDRISEWSGVISGYVVIGVTIVTCYEVVLRYVFNAPTDWGLELTIYMCGAMYVLGGPFVYLRRTHVGLDIVYRRLSSRGKSISNAVSFLIVLPFCIVLIWTGGEFAWRSLVTGETSGTAWDPMIFPVRVLVPLGAFLLLLQGAAHFIRDLKEVAARREEQ
jgi:TRAP-type mannitol/chloroaromatic compound transport system permease small subunit